MIKLPTKTEKISKKEIKKTVSTLAESFAGDKLKLYALFKAIETFGKEGCEQTQNEAMQILFSEEFAPEKYDFFKVAKVEPVSYEYEKDETLDSLQEKLDALKIKVIETISPLELKIASIEGMIEERKKQMVKEGKVKAIEGKKSLRITINS